MSLVDEVGGGLDGLLQLRALMASGRKPDILVALDFELVQCTAAMRATLLNSAAPALWIPVLRNCKPSA